MRIRCRDCGEVWPEDGSGCSCWDEQNALEEIRVIVEDNTHTPDEKLRDVKAVLDGRR